MTTSEKIAYIRNSYGLMLKQSSHEFLYAAYQRSQTLVEAYSIDRTISYADEIELVKEIEDVYSFCVDKLLASSLEG